jgi:SUN domain-containing protein 1/2
MSTRRTSSRRYTAAAATVAVAAINTNYTSNTSTGASTSSSSSVHRSVVKHVHFQRDPARIVGLAAENDKNISSDENNSVNEALSDTNSEGEGFPRQRYSTPRIHKSLEYYNATPSTAGSATRSSNFTILSSSQSILNAKEDGSVYSTDVCSNHDVEGFDTSKILYAPSSRTITAYNANSNAALLDRYTAQAQTTEQSSPSVTSWRVLIFLALLFLIMGSLGPSILASFTNPIIDATGQKGLTQNDYDRIINAVTRNVQSDLDKQHLVSHSALTSQRSSIIEQLTKERSAAIESAVKAVREELYRENDSNQDRITAALSKELERKLEDTNKQWADSVLKAAKQHLSTELSLHNKNIQAELHALNANQSTSLVKLRREVEELISTSQVSSQDVIKQVESRLTQQITQTQSEIEKSIIDAIMKEAEKKFATIKQLKALEDTIAALPTQTQPISPDSSEKAAGEIDEAALQRRILAALQESPAVISQSDRELIADSVRASVFKDLATIQIKRETDFEQLKVPGLVAEEVKKVQPTIQQLTHNITVLYQQFIALNHRIDQVDQTEREVVVAPPASAGIEHQQQIAEQLKAYVEELVSKLQSAQSQQQQQPDTTLAEEQLDHFTEKLHQLQLLQSALNNSVNSRLESLQSSIISQHSIEDLIYQAVSTSGHSNAQEQSLGEVDSPVIRSLIQSELERYSADRTGLVDYAARSSGGRIVAASISHRVAVKGSGLGWLTSWLKSCFLPTKKADEMLADSMSVGSCWPMNSTRGYAIIQLRESIIVTHASLQHISHSIAPDISTAPKKVSFYGINETNIEFAKQQPSNTSLGEYLGSYIYEINAAQVQSFPLINPHNHSYRFIRFSVDSNYGNTNYTCIYRVRIHSNKSQ